MKRLYISIIVLLISLHGHAEDAWSPEASTVTIKEQGYSSRIKTGFFQMSGVILKETDSLPMTNAFVTNPDQSVTTKTDNFGRFRIKFPISDSVIYFYKLGVNEVSITLNGERDQHYYLLEVKIADKAPLMVFKPVIYAYNTPPTGSQISILPKGEFTFTYPPPSAAKGLPTARQADSWNILADEMGRLIDQNTGRSYPYLFWEAEMFDLHFSKVSEANFNIYYIETDTTIQFLENELSKAGLNPREMTDFITFWGPRLTNYSYAKVQFLVDDGYDRIAELSITPAPNSVRRIYMLFEGINELDNKNYQTVKVKWTRMDREGYHLLEWGGSNLTKHKSEL